jgi:hypothetical protein
VNALFVLADARENAALISLHFEFGEQALFSDSVGVVQLRKTAYILKFHRLYFGLWKVRQIDFLKLSFDAIVGGFDLRDTSKSGSSLKRIFSNRITFKINVKNH